VVATSFGGSSQRLRLLLVGVAALCVAVAHHAAVESCPLSVTGEDGAEYTPHAARAAAVAWTADQTLPAQVLLVPANLRHLDGEFPALLHVIAALWARIVGPGIELSLYLNLLFVALLALSVGVAARQLALLSGRVDGDQVGWASTLGMVAAALVPSVFAAARQYDFDLPMAAWCAAAMALLLVAPRSLSVALVAGVVSAAAMLTCWSAVAFVVPLWGAAAVAAVVGRQHRSRADTVLRIGAGALVAALLCLPVLGQSRAVAEPVVSLFASPDSDSEQAWRKGSVDVALARGGGGVITGGEFVGRSLLDRVFGAVSGLVRSSLGLVMTCALLVCAAVGYRCWRLLVIGAAVCALPLLSLLVFTGGSIEPSVLGAVAPWIVAVAVASWASCRRAILRAVTLILVLGAGALQLAAVSGHAPTGGLLDPGAAAERRGWAAVGELPCSPRAELESMVRTVCGVGREGGHAFVDPALLQHRGIAWFVQRHCPQGMIDGAPEIPDELPGRPAAAITSRRLPHPWPSPCEQIDVRFRDVETVYRYWEL